MTANRPPKSTIVLDSLPDEFQNCLIGIDSQFFTVNKLLKGIKLIPEGLHFFHYSIPLNQNKDGKHDSTSQELVSLSLRYGYWFECIDNDVFIIRWDSEEEKLIMSNSRERKDESEQLNHSRVIDSIGDHYSFMVEYPENSHKWFNDLINYIDFEILMEFLPYDGFDEVYMKDINTMTPSKEENMILLETLTSKDPSKRFDDQSNNELKYTIIQFKINKPSSGDSSIEQITSNFLDKSWYLDELYGNDLDLLLGELQLSFINFIILGNFCSGLQWCNILKLISMSLSFIKRHQTFTLNFLKIFETHLQTIPSEYLVGDLKNEDSSNLIDLETYIGIMERFAAEIFPENSWNDGSCCGKMKLGGMINEKWNNIKIINQLKFGIHLSNLKISTNDGGDFEVYDLNDHEEDDEYAPVIVH